MPRPCRRHLRRRGCPLHEHRAPCTPLLPKDPPHSLGTTPRPMLCPPLCGAGVLPHTALLPPCCQLRPVDSCHMCRAEAACQGTSSPAFSDASTTPVPALREFPGQAGHVPISGGPSQHSTSPAQWSGHLGRAGTGTGGADCLCWVRGRNNRHQSQSTLSAWPLLTPLWVSGDCKGTTTPSLRGAMATCHLAWHPLVLGGHVTVPAASLPQFPHLGVGARLPAPHYALVPSFSPRCMGATRRTWAPLPRMRPPGCGCSRDRRRGTPSDPAARLSCWSTPRAAVPLAAVRATRDRDMGGDTGGHSPMAACSLGTAAHSVAVTVGRVSPAVTGHRRRGQCHLPAGQQGHNDPK